MGLSGAGHVLGIRPKGHPDLPTYNPDRDIAHCVPSLIRAVIWGLRKENWEPWIRPYIKSQALEESDLADAVVKFALGLRAMRLDWRVETPREALDKSGFLATPAAAQFVIMAKIGQIMTGAFFNAIKDVTKIGDGSRKDIEQMVEEAERTAHSIRND